MPPHKDVNVHDERQITQDFELPTPAPRLPLAGLVLDGPGGKPVRGASVIAVGQPPTGSEFSAMTGDDGRFRARRSPKPIVLYARSPDGALAGRAEVGADDQEATITLAPGVTATGRVTDAGGRPVEGADVQAALVHATPGGGQSHTYFATARTGRDGRYTIAGLPAGATVSIHARRGPPDFGGRDRGESASGKPMPATAGQDLNVPDLVMKGGAGL